MIILLHTFEGDISILSSLPLFHACVFLFRSLPIGTPRNEDTSERRGEGRNGQRVHDTSSSHFTIRNKKNFRTGTRLGRVSQVNVRWIS